MAKKLTELSDDQINEIIEKYELDKEDLKNVAGGYCDYQYVPTPADYTHPLGSHVEIYWMSWGDTGWFSHGGTVKGLAYRNYKEHTAFKTERFIYVDTGKDTSGWYTDEHDGIYTSGNSCTESLLTIIVHY